MHILLPWHAYHQVDTDVEATCFLKPLNFQGEKSETEVRLSIPISCHAIPANCALVCLFCFFVCFGVGGWRVLAVVMVLPFSV